LVLLDLTKTRLQDAYLSPPLLFLRRHDVSLRVLREFPRAFGGLYDNPAYSDDDESRRATFD
jgi:hypothetical protein